MTPIANPLESLRLSDLRRRTSTKWRRYGDDVLPLWVAEMDVAPAPAVVEAVCDAMARGDTGYAFGTAYAEAFAAYASDRWGWDGLAVARSAPVADVLSGVDEVIGLVTSPGDAVIVNNPVYPPFYDIIRHARREVVESPLDEGARIDLGALEDAMRRATVGGRAAAYLLCNPHNPTGTAHRIDELAAVAELAERHGVRVIADEIHAPLVLAGAHFVPYLSVPGAERGFAVWSASKAWNLAGLKAALLLAGPGAREDWQHREPGASHGASHVGVIAHAAALRDGREWLDEVLGGLDAQRERLVRLVTDLLPGVVVHRPEATYLAWLDCRALDLPEMPIEADAAGSAMLTMSGPAEFFWRRAKVALNDGAAFGTGGEGHVRLNFATSREILESALHAMADAVRSI